MSSDPQHWIEALPSAHAISNLPNVLYNSTIFIGLHLFLTTISKRLVFYLSPISNGLFFLYDLPGIISLSLHDL
jgi:hypothetical protein